MSNDDDFYYFFNKANVVDNEKVSSENDRMWRQAGYDAFYMILLKLGCFDGLKSTPLQSVRSAPFIESLRIITLHNIGL